MNSLIEKKSPMKPRFNTTAWIVCLLIPLFEPGSVGKVAWLSWLDPVYALGKIVSVLVVLILMLKKGRFNSLTVAALLFASATLLSTIVNHDDIMAWIKNYMPFVVICLIVMLYKDEAKSELLWAIFFVVFSLSVLNLLSAIVFPNGMYRSEGSISNDSYFWRHKNGAYQIILPSIAVSSIIDSRNGLTQGSKRTLAAFLVGFVQVILAYSATSFIAMIALVAGILLINSSIMRRLLNAFTFVGAYIVGYLGIVVFRVQDSLSLFFQSYLGRSASLTGRTTIWDLIFFYMDTEHMMLGYGSSYALLSQYNLSFISAHNMLLHLWFTGGVLAVASFCLVLFLSCRSLYRIRATKVTATIALIIGCFLVIGLTEAMLCTSFFLVIALGSCLDELLE